MHKFTEAPLVELADALRWALQQIEDDLDPDHQAAMAAAWEALAKAAERAPEDRPSPSFVSARESAIDEQAAMYDDPHDD